jgi:hypothetical protein
MSDYPDNLDTRPITEWPGQLTPAHRRQRSPFSAKLSSTLDVLRRELTQRSARHPVLEVAIPEQQFRVDGRPYANARADHPGVVLTLPQTDVGPLRFACDRYDTWQANLRAIALTMEALRAVDRYGATSRAEQYQGFKALPAGTGAPATGMTESDAVAILMRAAGLDPTQVPPTRDALRDVYADARKRSHPDHNDDSRAQWDLVDQASRVLTRAGRL